jgi:hypothetical protein
MIVNNKKILNSKTNNVFFILHKISTTSFNNTIKIPFIQFYLSKYFVQSDRNQYYFNRHPNMSQSYYPNIFIDFIYKNKLISNSNKSS